MSVTPAGASQLSVTWETPRKADGYESVTGYEVQWKAAAAGWNDDTAVSKAATTANRMELTGLVENGSTR